MLVVRPWSKFENLKVPLFEKRKLHFSLFCTPYHNSTLFRVSTFTLKLKNLTSHKTDCGSWHPQRVRFNLIPLVVEKKKKTAIDLFGKLHKSTRMKPVILEPTRFCNILQDLKYFKRLFLIPAGLSVQNDGSNFSPKRWWKLSYKKKERTRVLLFIHWHETVFNKISFH